MKKKEFVMSINDFVTNFGSNFFIIMWNLGLDIGVNYKLDVFLVPFSMDMYFDSNKNLLKINSFCFENRGDEIEFNSSDLDTLEDIYRCLNECLLDGYENSVGYILEKEEGLLYCDVLLFSVTKKYNN